MTRNDVLEAIHSYAVMTAFEASDGHTSIGQSSYKEYLTKFEQGMTDLMRDDALIPGDQITREVYFRYYHQRLWSQDELVRNPDLMIQREVEYDIAYRQGRKAKDAYWAKWDSIVVPGDVVIR